MDHGAGPRLRGVWVGLFFIFNNFIFLNDFSLQADYKPPPPPHRHPAVHPPHRRRRRLAVTVASRYSAASRGAATTAVRRSSLLQRAGRSDTVTI